MRILVTGHDGYIGAVLVPLLVDAGHEVSGLDTFLFRDCGFGPDPMAIPALQLDIRDVERQHLDGFDAVVHLAALSNDPLGELNPECTFDINHGATIRLAKLAREAGVERFVYASSCSLYGAMDQELLDEEAPVAPVTAYGRAKADAERDLALLASESFSPISLRNGTAYGRSPRLRTDLVINNLLGHAHTTGEVKVKSDGTQWRPMIHVEDIGRACLSVLDAPKEAIHNQAFNVGCTKENFRVAELARVVEKVVPGSRVTIGTGMGPDKRSYRVNCDKIAQSPIGFAPKWQLEDGVRDLYAAFLESGFSASDFASARYFRVKTVAELQEDGSLDDQLRWRSATQSAVPRKHGQLSIL